MISLLLAAALTLTPLDEAAKYPEGPLWQGGKLYVAEMGADSVFVREGQAKRVFFRQNGCGPTAIAPYQNGFVVLCHLGHRLALIDAQGAFLRNIERDSAGRPFDDPNDCFADAQGGVYFSDPGLFSKDAQASGEVYYLDAHGAVRVVAADLRYPNGVYVDQARGRLLVSEHLARRVLAFAILDAGQLGPAAVFADIGALTPQRGQYREAGPDGLERAPNGEILVALYGEGRLLRLDGEGKLLGEILVPAPFVTNMAFDSQGHGAVVGAFVNDLPPFLGGVWQLDGLGIAPKKAITHKP
jgi:gluconolactonase